MSRERDDEEQARSLGGLLRRATEQREDARRDQPELRRRDVATRQRLVEAMGEGRAAPRPRGAHGAGPAWLLASLWMRVALGGAGVVAVALAAFLLLRSPALDYSVSGAPEVAGYVRADARPATVSFEDGTALELAPGASGRVSEVRSNGARFVLEDGAVDARVKKLPGAAWSVHAGPWEVRVTGTAFLVTWDARQSHLRIAMREGSVVVHGPGAEAGIGLRAGQSLDAGDDGAIQVAAADLPSEGARAPGSGGAASPADPGATPSPSAEPGSLGGEAVAVDRVGSSPRQLQDPPTAPRPWPARVAAGDYDGVLAEAEKSGVDAVLASASASDLSAFADAARYRGRAGLATRALQSLRDRFPGSAPAANAAFLLGRMSDDAGNPASALRWYDAHLAEGGAFAAEALGRKMLVVRRTSGDAAAATVARAYLARYPGGAHAAIARTLAEEPTPAPAPGGALPPDAGTLPDAP